MFMRNMNKGSFHFCLCLNVPSRAWSLLSWDAVFKCPWDSNYICLADKVVLVLLLFCTWRFSFHVTWDENV